jgi:hypothetical protein
MAFAPPGYRYFIGLHPNKIPCCVCRGFRQRAQPTKDARAERVALSLSKGSQSQQAKITVHNVYHSDIPPTDVIGSYHLPSTPPSSCDSSPAPASHDGTHPPPVQKLTIDQLHRQSLRRMPCPATFLMLLQP